MSPTSGLLMSRWKCSGSFRHCAMGEIGSVEIESEWTALRREREVHAMDMPKLLAPQFPPKPLILNSRVSRFLQAGTQAESPQSMRRCALHGRDPNAS
jgi:hypothetical protein